LSSLSIPPSVTNIVNFAFVDCTSLTNISIPSNVTNIGLFAFQSCTKLTGIFFQGEAPAVGLFTFASDPNAAAYYLPGTTGWSAFSASAKIPTVLWNPMIQNFGSTFGVQSNQFGFTVTGTTNIPIVVEACTNLASPAWAPIASMTLTNGSVQFSDPQTTNFPTRFYGIGFP